jgi:hypothetical protein
VRQIPRAKPLVRQQPTHERPIVGIELGKRVLRRAARLTRTAAWPTAKAAWSRTASGWLVRPLSCGIAATVRPRFLSRWSGSAVND